MWTSSVRVNVTVRLSTHSPPAEIWLISPESAPSGRGCSEYTSHISTSVLTQLPRPSATASHRPPTSSNTKVEFNEVLTLLRRAVATQPLAPQTDRRFQRLFRSSPFRRCALQIRRGAEIDLVCPRERAGVGAGALEEGMEESADDADTTPLSRLAITTTAVMTMAITATAPAIAPHNAFLRRGALGRGAGPGLRRWWRWSQLGGSCEDRAAGRASSGRPLG